MIHQPRSCPNCNDTGTVILGTPPVCYGYCFNCGLTGPRAENEEQAVALFNNLGGQVIVTEWVAEISPDNEITFALHHLTTDQLVFYSYDLFPDGKGGTRAALFLDQDKTQKIRAWKQQNSEETHD